MNVVDIGVGNAYPVKPLLSHLLEIDKLGRYIAIDISPEMLNIAERNIKEWFGSRVRFQGLELDITRERFTTMLAQDYISKSEVETGNLILFLGGTIQNFRKRDAPLQAIADSMGIDDLLVHTQKLDTPASRRFFDFNIESSSSTLAANHRFIFDLLSIDESFYDVEMGFDEKLRERYIRVRMKMAASIEFEFDEGSRSIDLNRGETILLWRASQDSALDVMNQLERNDLYALQTSQTDDHEYMLTVSQIKRES